MGISPTSVLAFLDAVESAALELHSLMVVRHGRVAAEGWWAPYSADRPHLLYSLSKSFTSAAVGFAVHEGVLGLGDTVVSLLPDHVPDDVDPIAASLTVANLLSMSTGHREDTLDRAWSLEPHDIVRGFLRLPPEEPVGSRHAYNNGCSYVLAAVVQDRSGEHLLDYLRPRLLDPLGVGPAHWDNDENGRALGFTGLHLTTEAVASFGQLLLQRGEWEGRQLLPTGWVDLATRRHVATGLDPDAGVDWSQGYGQQFWMSRHGFRGDGAYGQFCLVLPEEDLVVVTTAVVPDMQALIDAVWDHLLPGLDSAPGTAEAAATGDDEIAVEARLRALALPALSRSVADAPESASYVVAAGPDQQPVLDAGTAVTVTQAAGGWDVTMGTAVGRLELGCGEGAWVESRLRGQKASLVRAARTTRQGGAARRGPGGVDRRPHLRGRHRPHRATTPPPAALPGRRGDAGLERRAAVRHASRGAPAVTGGPPRRRGPPTCPPLGRGVSRSGQEGDEVDAR